jgi:4-hydroxybenzoate polyprenyltransferase
LSVLTDLTPTLDRPARQRRLAGTAAALRVPQWVKNLLLFAGLLFAARLGDVESWLEAVSAFAVYCLASSAAYLVNDVCDANRDRLHPVKRHRPVASGALLRRSALLMSASLLALSFAIAVVLGHLFLLFLSAFVLLQIAYSLALKHVVALDVAAIATLFVLRAGAGAAAVHVRISPWLLICTASLALFLALAKRRGELLLVRSGETPGRPVLTGYSLPVVERLLAAAAGSTLLAYSAYTFTARDSLEMTVTLPIVFFAVLRYLLLVQREGAGEQPEHVLLTERPILAAAILWAVTSALVLTLP